MLRLPLIVCGVMVEFTSKENVVQDANVIAKITVQEIMEPDDNGRDYATTVSVTAVK